MKFGWEPMGQSEALDLELVPRGARGIGDGTLLIDAGCIWDARTALRRAHGPLPNTESNGWKNLSGQKTTKGTPGCAADRLCRLRPVKRNAVVRRFAP